MLTSLKNEEGYIYALIEWEVLTLHGRREYCLVKYAWVHPEHRKKGCLATLVIMMTKHEYGKGCQFVGWEKEGEDFKWIPVYMALENVLKLNKIRLDDNINNIKVLEEVS